MVDDDTFTYHVKQQPANQINTAVHSLITKERMQKLDLLIHLLSNLTQALVVCGPEGIGKTTLLDLLQKRKSDIWRYCLIQGNAELSFETIHGQLTRCIKADAPVNSLSTAFKQYENQHKQVVLIVDNAGELVPGLIAAIIQYAAANPVLRVVFALTHDELQVKRGSDRIVDDCHVIEIPPLSEKQCGDFLQDLSTKPYANLSFKAIGENMIAHIYRDTHGVPGRIIAEVSGLSGAKSSGKLIWIFVLAVSAVCAIAFGFQWFASSKDKEVASTLIAVEQKADAVEIAAPRPDVQRMLPLPPAQSDIQSQQPVSTKADSDAQQPVFPIVEPDASSSIVIKPLPEPLEAQPQPVSVDADEVLQQKIVEPQAVSQEKPKQPELSKTVNNVKQPVLKKSVIKVLPELANKVSEPVVESQKIVEPLTTNKLETTPIAQTPEADTISKEPAIDASLQQAEPSHIGSQPITTLPPSQVTGRTGSLPVASLPPSPAVEASSTQSDNNFTLQLMVLSKQFSADDILKKYPALEPDIRVIKTIAKGKEKFILEYGSYSDAASANKARESLPFEFRKALVRKIAR